MANLEGGGGCEVGKGVYWKGRVEKGGGCGGELWERCWGGEREIHTVTSGIIGCNLGERGDY